MDEEVEAEEKKGMDAADGRGDELVEDRKKKLGIPVVYWRRRKVVALYGRVKGWRATVRGCRCSIGIGRGNITSLYEWSAVNKGCTKRGTSNGKSHGSSLIVRIDPLAAISSIFCQ